MKNYQITYVEQDDGNYELMVGKYSFFLISGKAYAPGGMQNVERCMREVAEEINQLPDENIVTTPRHGVVTIGELKTELKRHEIPEVP